MRKLLVATMMCASVVMQASASTPDLYQPEMKAYLNFGFGAPAVQSLGLHYGFRMDYGSGLRTTFGGALPSMMQLDFTGDHGFSSAQLNGRTFLTRSVQLNADGDASAGASGGATSTFTTVDWGLLVVGLAGVGYGIYEVSKGNESPDPKPAASTTGTAPSNGNCVPGTVPLIGGQCAPTTPPGAGGACAPGTVPVVGGQCAPNPTTGTTPPGAGGACAPGTVPVIGGQCAPTAPQGAGGTCAPGTVPIIGGQCAPVGFSSLDRRFVIEDRDVNYNEWLNTDNGHMGDLIAR